MDTTLKVSRLLATSLEILVANIQFSIALATSWSQFWTLYSEIYNKTFQVFVTLVDYIFTLKPAMLLYFSALIKITPSQVNPLIEWLRELSHVILKQRDMAMICIRVQRHKNGGSIPQLRHAFNAKFLQ